jgi:hypothetical protein
MMQRVFIALLTASVFLAGYWVRMVTQSTNIVPPPPAGLASELGANQPEGKSKSSPEVDRAKLLAEIEKIRPQIEAYRAQVDEIYTEFDREFAKILTPEQHKTFVVHQKRWSDLMAKRQADRKPLTDEDIMRARERPLTEVYWMVTITPRLERLTKEYQLTEQQHGTTRALLSMRRSKFMALLDSTPHPSIRLSRLAPMMERVAEPPSPAAK